MSSAQVLSGYYLLCPHGHEIPIPRPSRVGTDGNLQQIEKDNRQAIFVCPICGTVSAYSGREIHHQLLDKPDPFSAGVYCLVAIEVKCDDESCEARTVVHALGGDATKGTWIATTDKRKWTPSESARCGNGHQLCFDSLRTVEMLDSPF